MSPELSDLLREAKADAPPPRYDVEDAVAAGRRLQRRRRAGVAVAAVVAVAAAIGVPQIVTHGGRGHRPVPVAPTVTPYQFGYTSRGYTAGGYRVTAPRTADLWGYRTGVYPLNGGGDAVASLEVYRPGVDPRTAFPGALVTFAAPVKGRPAYFIKKDGQDILVWEYAAGARAQLWSISPKAMSRERMRTVAEGFAPGAFRPATIPFRVGYVPDGYRLSAVTGQPSADGTGFASLGFLPETLAVSRLGQAGPLLLTDEMKENNTAGEIGIAAVRLRGDDDPGPGKVVCVESEPMCAERAPGGKYLLRVTGRLTSTAELRRILESVRLADMADPGTWTQVTAAVPRPVQLPAR